VLAISPESATADISTPKPNVSVLESVQLALARQDVKERESSDDIRSRSDDSYSPRRHWCSI
jgi:hypothetical protein